MLLQVDQVYNDRSSWLHAFNKCGIWYIYIVHVDTCLILRKLLLGGGAALTFMSHACDVWVHQSPTSMYCTKTKVEIDGAQCVWVYLDIWSEWGKR